MVSLITDKLGRQTLQDVDGERLLPEVLLPKYMWTDVILDSGQFFSIL